MEPIAMLKLVFIFFVMITYNEDFLKAKPQLLNDTLTIHESENLTSMVKPTVEFRRNRFWREWRRGDPSVNKNMWSIKKPLGKAELYIILALLIGFSTVVVGCWLSDNCWSPEPEHLVMIA